MVTSDALLVETSVPTTSSGPRLPAESFSWQVLSALADDIEAAISGGNAAIRLTKRRPS
jgi:serine/threonine-protein kinase RsbW